MSLFRDRRQAGERLAARLAAFAPARPVVLALPRGGVVVGFEVARALGAPLDVVVARKLATPGDPELALGAVAEGDLPGSVFNPALVASLEVGEEYLRGEISAQLKEVARRQQAYRGGRPPEEVEGRVAILVDDGVATGASLTAALRALRRRGPASLVLAVPVAAADSWRELAAAADEAVCLEQPSPFVSVGTHYEDFRQTEDAEVVALLESARGKKW